MLVNPFNVNLAMGHVVVEDADILAGDATVSATIDEGAFLSTLLDIVISDTVSDIGHGGLVCCRLRGSSRRGAQNTPNIMRRKSPARCSLGLKRLNSRRSSLCGQFLCSIFEDIIVERGMLLVDVGLH